MQTETFSQTSAKPTVKARRNPRGVFEKARGSGEWWIRYVDATGRYRRELSGTKSAALKLYTKRKQQALEGRKLPETLRQPAVSFKQIADAAIADIERRYRRPADDVARLRTAIDWFGSWEAGSLTPGEIEGKLSAVAAAEGWAASTANHYRNVMSLAYRLAKRDGKVQSNPVRDVAHRKENNQRVRCLNPDEERALRGVIREHYRAHEEEFDFALHTGLRQGTQYQLTWEMVDLGARLLRIPRTKNEEPLVLPLNDAALGVLRRLRSRANGAAHVFLSDETGRPFGHGPKHWFTPAVRKAEIEDFHWHDLRHTFATRLREKGVPLEDIADLLGHKGLQMTRRYAHTDMKRLQRAVGRLARKPTDTSVAPTAIPAPAPAGYVN